MKFKTTKEEILKKLGGCEGLAKYLEIVGVIELEGEPVDKCRCVGCEVKQQEKPKKIEEISKIVYPPKEDIEYWIYRELRILRIKTNQIIKHINDV